jgi:sulfite dehydrogenase (quinone) subunit SoeC
VNPAYSIIFFTTASGAGYGLLALLSAYALAGDTASNSLRLISLGLSGVLVTAGLLSSTLHLGHPERAWRALSQWRSSWLSREGVLALACYVPALCWAWLLWRDAGDAAWLPLASGVLALATVYATSMIYASLKTVDAWHRPSVTVNYLLLALASGALLWLALRHWHDAASAADALLTASLLAAAAFGKWGYWSSLDATGPAVTIEAATGLGRLGPVSSLAWPHTEQSYLLKEMGYEVARRHSRRLRRIALLGAFIVPAACALAGIALPATAGAVLVTLALPALALGLVVERWLFFAEARHAVSAFYGR